LEARPEIDQDCLADRGATPAGTTW